MIRVPAGDRDTLVTFERPVADTSFRGAGSGDWEAVGDEWVSLIDQLPSRSEQAGSGMPVSLRRARLRMDYRADITPDMRITLDGSPMQIIAGPATLGRQAGLEMMVEAYRAPGNPA